MQLPVGGQMTTDYVQRIRNVPTLPSVLAKLISTLDDPRSSAGDLEAILRNDQALTTKLLAVANSAYYAFRHRITSVRRAVVAVGFAEVRNICMGLSLMGFLNPRGFKNPKAAEAMWLHALMTAEGAKVVAGQGEGLDQDTGFTVGLLHDIGKVVLAAFFPDDLARVVERMKADDLDYRQAEKQEDADHQLVGRALAVNWKMPSMFAEVMGRHHTPSSATPHFTATCVTHCADFLSNDLGYYDTYRTSPPPS